MSPVVLLHWSFTVQWCREGGISVILCVSSNLSVHRSMGHVSGYVGVAIESLECFMRNVDAQEERERERERERGRGREREPRLPTTFLYPHLPHDFSSLSLYQHPSQSAAREKINFLLPDYIIRLPSECQLNIPHQHFIRRDVAWYRGEYSKAGLWVGQGRPAV